MDTKKVYELSSCLNFEKSNFNMADAFYRRIGYNIVMRHNWDDPNGKEAQKKDIDLTVSASFAGPKNLTRTAKISEKFRRIIWTDCWIEILSDINGETGSNLKSEADYQFYYMKTNEQGALVYVLDSQKLKDLARTILDTIRSGPDAISDYLNGYLLVEYGGYKIDCLMKSCPTYVNGQCAYRNLGACIDWTDLMNLGIVITRYDL